MSATIRSLVIPVSDLNAAKAIYTALLGVPHTDQPYYVGYNVGGFEVALNPGDGTGGPVAFTDVEDLDATRATLLAAGASELSAPRQRTQLAPPTRQVGRDDRFPRREVLGRRDVVVVDDQRLVTSDDEVAHG